MTKQSEPVDLVSLRLAISGDLDASLLLLAPEIEDSTNDDEYVQYLLLHRSIIFYRFGRWTDERNDLLRALAMPCGDSTRRLALIGSLGRNAEHRNDIEDLRRWYREALDLALADADVKGGWTVGLALVKAVGERNLDDGERVACAQLIERGWRDLEITGPPRIETIGESLQMLIEREKAR